MILQKDFLNKAKDFGINSYEAKLWTALLSRGTATAGELSDIANVPRSRSYDVLESLEKKGFVIMKIGKPIKYIAVPPTEVLERVKKNIYEDVKKQEETLNILKQSEVLNQLENIYKTGSQHFTQSDILYSITGRKNIQNHIISLIKKAQKSIVIVTTHDGFIRKTQELSTLLKKAAEKNIEIKITAPITQKEIETIPLQQKNIDIKHYPHHPFRMCIIDSKSVFILPTPDTTPATQDIGIWINTEFLAKGLHNMIQSVWPTLKIPQK